MRDSGTETVTLLRELLAGQQALASKLDALAGRLAPGPRDHADERLVGIIATSTRGLTFTAKAAWAHRKADETLADGLLSCDIESPLQLGKLLRRLEGRDVAGFRIVCVGLCRDGKIWRAEAMVRE